MQQYNNRMYFGNKNSKVQKIVLGFVKTVIHTKQTLIHKTERGNSILLTVWLLSFIHTRPYRLKFMKCRYVD